MAPKASSRERDHGLDVVGLGEHVDRLRRRVLRSLAWRWPSLFALQFIVKLARREPSPER